MKKKFLFYSLSVTMSCVLTLGGNECYSASQPSEATNVDNRPNILLIVADDLGYSDVGAYGGEIQTPRIDSLANSGLQMTNFHANPSCSPTRAALLSGTDTHIAGLGVMHEMRNGPVSPEQKSAEGYQGYLLPSVDTLPAKLLEAGYHTYMAGKWHLANMGKELPATIPSARGFEKSFALIPGGASHYGDGLGPLPSPFPVGDHKHNQRALYVEDKRIGQKLPADFYSTTYYTDKLISYIDANKDDGKPYFAWAAYTAPHWPLQLPLEALEEGNVWQKKFVDYETRYSAGYDVLRNQRLEQMKQLGLVTQDTDPNSWAESNRGKGIPAWSSLSADQQKVKAREMAVYAVMIEYMDYQIGRLLEHVDQNNTIVMFMSDNGAEAIKPTAFWKYMPTDSEAEYTTLLEKTAGTADYNGYDNLGRPGSYLSYDAGWTQVSALPHRGHKIMTTEGGIRVPMIVKYPRMKQTGIMSDAFGTIMDLMPTFLEVAQAEAPAQALRGSTMVPLLSGASNSIHDKGYGVGWELLGSKAYVEDDYKLFMKSPLSGGHGKWELYNLQTDQAESHDLFNKPKYAEIGKSLIKKYDQYSNETGVVPFP